MGPQLNPRTHIALQRHAYELHKRAAFTWRGFGTTLIPMPYPSTAAKATTTATMAAVLILAACSDPSMEETFESVNDGQIVSCEAGAYPAPNGTFGLCTEACATEPAVNAKPLPEGVQCCVGAFGCDPTRWVEHNGYIGVCGALAEGELIVKWYPCAGQ